MLAQKTRVNRSLTKTNRLINLLLEGPATLQEIVRITGIKDVNNLNSIRKALARRKNRPLTVSYVKDSRLYILEE